jgi:pantoate--beta-alanine ligase
LLKKQWNYCSKFMALDTQSYDIPAARSVDDLRQCVAGWRSKGAKIALVPTMGALHRGHMSLIEEAAKTADKIVVSIFVNPAQFAPDEDFDSYPRTEPSDAKKLGKSSTNLIYAPMAHEMYGSDFSTSINVDGISEGLCSATRPHFFAGVAVVVAKLLLQCLPDVAVFGEKDYQQLLVIRRMVRDLNIPVDISSGPTAREKDGLAISSRNVYLTPKERDIAPALQKTLQAAAESLKDGKPLAETLEHAISHLSGLGFGPVDYLELRNAETLAPLAELSEPARLLVAATLGKTRLIDNIPV